MHISTISLTYWHVTFIMLWNIHTLTVYCLPTLPGKPSLFQLKQSIRHSKHGKTFVVSEWMRQIVYKSVCQKFLPSLYKHATFFFQNRVDFQLLFIWAGHMLCFWWISLSGHDAGILGPVHNRSVISLLLSMIPTILCKKSHSNPLNEEHLRDNRLQKEGDTQ